MEFVIPPPPPDDPRRRVRFRETALEWLRRMPMFATVSRRFFTDIVDVAEHHELRPQSPRSSFRLPGIALLLVIEGEVIVEPAAAPAPPGGAPPGPPSVRREGESPPPLPARLQPGVYLGSDARWSMERDLRITVTGKESAYVVAVSRKEMARWLRASPAMLHSIGFSEGYQLLVSPEELWAGRAHGTSGVKPDINVEFIWLAKAPHVPAPLEALAHILAGGIAQQFEEPPAVFVHGRDPEMLIWRNDTLEAAGEQPTADTMLTTETVTDLMHRETTAGAEKKHYALFLRPDDPTHLPRRYHELKFHRIVYVTDGASKVIPDGLEKLLHDDFVGPSGSVDYSTNPPFGAFITTILIGERARFRDYVAALITRSLTWGTSVQDFRTRVIHDDLHASSTAAPFHPEHKLHRDLCRVRLDLVAIEQQWKRWQARSVAQPTPFIDTLKPAQNHYESSASRWAAAVTNRRTGLGLSGGGASAYRVGPLLDRLRQEKVPIHVLAGLSGGALIGAYCAVDPEHGFDRVARRGPLFSSTLWLVMYATLPLEIAVNCDLDGARLEEMETRFVPVTTRLPESTPPQATAVVRGTIGEGVRASGTLPPPFAPTRKNGVRYTDGGASAVVPAALLRDFGADVVLAVNCIPGPERTNPYDWSPLISWYYNYTPFGRALDGWAWAAFSMQRTSRRFGRSADVFLEYEPVTVPFWESIEFFWPRRIAQRAEEGNNGQDIHDAAREFKRKWRQLGNP